MSKETEAIKAVALVAEQAYREVFHVDDTATTTELNVLADAVAALDKPTPAPEPPKAIRDNKNPPPPHELVNALQDPVHIPRVGRLISSTPIKIKPESTLPDEVEAAVNKAESECQSALTSPGWEHLRGVGIEAAFARLEQRLASLWPKPGQVPSVAVTQLVAWAEQEYPDLYNRGREIPGDFFTRLADHLSRMGQPATLPPQSELDKCAADELRRIEVKAGQPSPVKPDYLGYKFCPKCEGKGIVPATGNPTDGFDRCPTCNPEPATREEAEKVVRAAAGRRPDFPSGKDYVDYVRGPDVSPSPVTAEKLVEQIRTIPNPWSGDVDLFQNIRLATRQGFEECREAVLKLVRSQGLAQPALTREQVETVFENEFPSYSQGYRSRVVDDILVLSSRTVSKEQWEKLEHRAMGWPLANLSVVRQWLKEIGMEVAE